VRLVLEDLAASGCAARRGHSCLIFRPTSCCARRLALLLTRYSTSRGYALLDVIVILLLVFLSHLRCLSSTSRSYALCSTCPHFVSLVFRPHLSLPILLYSTFYYSLFLPTSHLSFSTHITCFYSPLITYQLTLATQLLSSPRGLHDSYPPLVRVTDQLAKHGSLHIAMDGFSRASSVAKGARYRARSRS
jgi:hypothetical protein